jgi:hypothetical protein
LSDVNHFFRSLPSAEEDDLRVLSNLPVVAPWQKLEQGAPQPGFTTHLPFQVDLGHPLSVLPDAVQESLRQGQPVDPKDIVPVPAY